MTITKKVAIIGSRDFKNKELLDVTMKKLQENIIIGHKPTNGFFSLCSL